MTGHSPKKPGVVEKCDGLAFFSLLESQSDNTGVHGRQTHKGPGERAQNQRAGDLLCL